MPARIQNLKHKDCSHTGIRLLLIPGGRFQMGAEDIDEDSRPVHWVRVSHFWLGETPVTNQQYKIFLKETNHREPDYWRDRRFSGDMLPVVGVSWHDAATFCKWLSKISDCRYHLPSEAQWEFAAKGTDGRRYPWGNETPDATRALFKQDCIVGKPATVGSFPLGKGPFGTLDQAGNVWEWCCDVWDAKAYGMRKGKETVDPVITEGGKLIRPMRGGSYWLGAVYLRCAYRFGNLVENQDQDGGFRVALSSMG